MTTHSQRALILYSRRRFINHLLTYLLILQHSRLMVYARRTTTCGVQLCFTTTLQICRHRPISRDLRRDLASPSQIVAYRLSNSLIYCSDSDYRARTEILSSRKWNRVISTSLSLFHSTTSVPLCYSTTRR